MAVLSLDYSDAVDEYDVEIACGQVTDRSDCISLNSENSKSHLIQNVH